MIRSRDLLSSSKQIWTHKILAFVLNLGLERDWNVDLTRIITASPLGSVRSRL